MKSSLEILIAFGAWRKGDCSSAALDWKPSEITIAIDDAIAALRERDVARKAAISMAGEIVRFHAILAEASRLTK